MAKPRPSSLRTAKRRAAWSLACCAATLLLLVSQGVESPRVAAQGPSPVLDVEGTLEVLYEDSVAGARLTHYLNTGTERLPLRFARNPPERLLTGARVRVRGARRNGMLMADTGADVSSLSDASSPVASESSLGSGTSGLSTVPLASPNTFGPQSTLVILFNFSDNATQPYSRASAESVTFTDVNTFDLENSFGQTSLEGTVVGWYTIGAVSGPSCSYNTWASQAEQAAANAGVNLALYPRRVFGFPQTAACSWWGLGTVGGGTDAGNPSRAWINGPYSLRVVGHEMGHNFGLNHSRSNICDATGCLFDEYGDDHDIMGAVTGHFNAYQKERLGWLGYGSSPAIQAVTQSGQYPVEAYATANGGLPKALKIFKSAAGSSNTYIYAEARTQTGADASLTPGVVIHTGVDTDSAQIYLQDLRPTTSTTDFILDPGQSVTFSDTGSPITLTALSFDATGAVVAVTVPCSYSLSSAGQFFELAGGTGNVGLTTGSSCAWSATSNDSWISVNPGSTGGTGPSTISFSVVTNPLPSIRTGTLTIGGQTFTVTQAGLSCGYTVSPSSPAFNYTGGAGAVSVTTSSGCAWPATSNATWITITAGASGTGNGSVTYSVEPHTAQTARIGTLIIAGRTVTVTQEGVAALFALPFDGMNPVATSSLFSWSFVTAAQRYVLTVGTTPGGADLWDTGEIAQTSAVVNNLPASRLLYARVRTKFDATTWTRSDISFTTVDHASSVQVMGAQTPSPVSSGQSTQYGASAGTSVQITFTGAGGGCTTAPSATGLPSGATATFAPSSVTSSAINQFTLLTIATTTATPPGSYTVTVKAQESGVCGSGFVTATVPLIVSNSTTATTLSPVAASGTYAGSSPASATLSASGSPLSGKTIAFTLNGNAVGTAVTNASGVATLASVSLIGISAGSYPGGVGASFAGDVSYTASSGNSALTVSQKSVTPTVTVANKLYDGTTSATLTSCTLSGVVGGDAVSCPGGTATFATASVATGKTVTVSGLILTGAASGNYALTTTTAISTAAITAAPVTPTVTVANKVYDGTTSATLTSCTLSGVIGGDAVGCTGGTATFATASVGTGKTVTVSGLTLTGAALGNYALTTTVATTTATITAAPVTTGLVAAYAFSEGTGTTVADASGLGNTGTLTNATWTAAGKYGGALAFNGSSARVTIPDALSVRLTTAMTLEAWVNPSTVSSAWRDVIYKGDDNYLLEATSTNGGQPAAGAILGTSDANTFGPAALGVNTWTHLAATYDGAQVRLYVNGTQVSSVARTGPLMTSTNPLQIGGDSLYGQYFAGLIDDVRVYNVALTAVQIQADMNTPIGSATAAPDLTVTKTHVGGFTQGQTGATYTVTVSNSGTGPTSGVVTVVDTLPGGLTATALAGTGWSCTLGTLTCTRSDALAAGATYPIVTVTVTVASTAPATVTNQATVSGGGETNTGNNSASDPTAIAPAPVADLTVTKTHAGGFTQGQTGATYTVTVRNSGTGPTSGAVTLVDTLPGGLTATALAGTGWSCTLGTLTCTRSDALAAGTNYPAVTVTVTVASTAPATVTNQVTVSGGGETNTANNGASDPTTITSSATATTLAVAVASGPYGGASALAATLSASGSPVSGKTIAFTVNGSAAGTAVTNASGVATVSNASLAGLSAGSYPTGVGASFAGDAGFGASNGTNALTVSQKSVTPTVTAANKVYDGTASATVASCTLSGVIGADAVSCPGGTAAFATASVGTGKTVTVSGLTLTGTAAGNYALTTTTATTTAAITAAPVTPTVTVPNKVYDGTPSATVASCTLSGVIGADAVGCTGTATFATGSAGTGKTVTVGGLTLTGAALGNYALTTTTATTTAAVTARSVAPTVTAANKVYDGTTSATLTSCTLSGVIGGDVVSCTGTATFATASVGTGKTVTVSGLTLTGAALGNYALTTTVATTTAAITAAPVTTALVAAYAFSEGTGTTVADASGLGNTGTLTNATWTAAGKYGGALAFNGSSARVTIPDALSVRLTTAMTLEAWVNPSTVSSAWRDVIYKGDDNYLLEATSTNGGQPAAGAILGTSDANTFGPAALGVNTWTHLAATYDGAQVRLYVNGTQVSSVARTGPLMTSTNPLQIGGDSLYGQYFAGLIDDVRVYNVALTAVQIQADMNTPIGSATAAPDLTVTKTHVGGFTQGQTGATYTVTVSNSGTGPTSGVVTVVDTLPGGLTATALAGTGWSCTLGTLTCTRSDALAAGATYPIVTVTVTVASTAPATVTNQATVSGGGETNTGNNSASDPTAIAPAPVADLTVTKTHAGGFTQGQTGATYTVTVQNAGTGPTSGVVTVVDTLPGGLTATALAGTGWSCTLGTLTCTRSDALAAGTNYPAVTVTVTVASTAPATVTNQVTVSGGGETNTANNGASDPTTITSSATATTLAVAVASGPYGGASALAATLSASGSPVSGKTIAFTVNGSAAGTAVTNASGVATVSNASLAGLSAGSYPTGVGASFAGDAGVGASNGTNALTVSQKSVTPTVTAANKVYDGTASATVASCTLSGVIGADAVSCPGGTAAFATASVGTGKTVTVSGLTLTGTAAGNYVLVTTTATTTAAITARSVAPTVTVANKVYDGTTSATLTSCALSGVIGGDVVSCTGTATFATASVGTGKTVTVSGLTLTGAALGNYALTTTTATTTAAITAAPVTTALVAAYGFNEGTGLTVGDASGTGNTGTVTNATWATAGKYGGALSFNGSSARVTIPDALSVRLTTAMTLEAWVNPSTVSSAWRDVIYKGDDNYLLEATSGNSGWPAAGAILGTSDANTYGVTTLSVNTWTHLAATYDGAQLRLYVNGTQVSSIARTGPLMTSSNPLQIGGDSLYGQYFAGLIDDVRVYNVALTAAQIQFDMTTPVAP